MMTRHSVGNAARSLVLSSLLVLMPGGLLAGEAFAGQSTGQTSGQAAGQALPLTMEQAVTMALEANLGLKAERLNLDIASHSVALARSAFLRATSVDTIAAILTQNPPPVDWPSDVPLEIRSILER